MENLIEKIKGLDKKILIGAGIGAAIIIILIVVLVIGLDNKKPTGGNTGNSQNSTQIDSQVGMQTEGGVTEMFGTEDVTEVVGTETEMPETEITETESEEESQTPNSSQAPSTGGTTVTQPEDVGGVEQSPVTTTPEGEEMFGLGTADAPYEINPDGNTMTFTTVAIPAGDSVYYSVMKTVNKWFTIDDPNAYVEFNGVKYEAKNGVLSFKVEDAKALVTDYLVFKIGNNGSTEKKFTIELTDEKGTFMNPERVGNVGTYSVHLEKGNAEGYYYKHTVKQSGTLRFYINSASSASGISVTNNNTMAQRNFGEEDLLDAYGKEYIEISVSAGDELVIIVSAERQKGTYPAADVTWQMLYSN